MKNMLDLGQMLKTHARLSPDRIGARDLERSLTFHQWNARACRLANALLGVGLAKGDRVAILAYNTLEWVEIYAATAKAGLVAVPVNFRLVGKEIRYIVDDAEAAAIIVQDQLVEALEEIGTELSAPRSRRIWFGPGRCPPGFLAYEELMSGARDSEPEIAVAPEDPWMLMYTSGTTGAPKGAIRNHRGGAMLSLITEIELGLSRDDGALTSCRCATRTPSISAAPSPTVARQPRSTAARALIRSIAYVFLARASSRSLRAYPHIMR
jgi:fatty-acyl-CoA synthase